MILVVVVDDLGTRLNGQGRRGEDRGGQDQSLPPRSSWVILLEHLVLSKHF